MDGVQTAAKMPESPTAGGIRRARTALVTAAFGRQGKSLIPKLAAMGFQVRAVRGRPGREDEVRKLGAHEVHTADISDPEAYAALMEGVDVVYHIGPSAHPREREMGEALVVAAKIAGVRHVVFSSVLHPIIDILQHRIKRDVEVLLIESGLNYTVLKPCDYMMPEQYSLPAFLMGIYPAFWPLDIKRRGSLVDIEDITDVAARVMFEGEAHYDASYELVGPDKLCADDVANILSRVTGTTIKPVEWTPEEMVDKFFGPGNKSDEARQHLAVIRSISNWYRQYDFVGNSNVLRWLLGRPPTSFETYARRAYAEFQAGAKG